MAGRLAAMGNVNYAVVVRGSGPTARWNGQVRLVESALDAPRRWRRPRRIFVNSMSDLFHPAVPADWIGRILAVVRDCPGHRFLVLTKRPGRIAEMLRAAGYADPPANLWLGASVSTAEDWHEAWPHLAALDGVAVRFVSAEPMIEDVFADDVPGDAAWGLEWIILGGESGPGARLCRVAWLRRALAEFAGWGVSVFVKQLGASSDHPVTGAGEDMSQWPADLRVRQMPARTR
jgi:protein gp37